MCWMVSQKAPSAKRCIKTFDVLEDDEDDLLCQKAPSAKRCIKTPDRRSCSPCGWTVRKHRAPKGALRLVNGPELLGDALPRQKAPSAKRCIKTRWNWLTLGDNATVRKHRAPKGALRRKKSRRPCNDIPDVRKHRAPKGALRLRRRLIFVVGGCRRVRKHRAPKGAFRQHCRWRIQTRQIALRQKAPSAKRCIKTIRREMTLRSCPRYVRKHRAPKGALRPSAWSWLCLSVY